MIKLAHTTSKASKASTWRGLYNSNHPGKKYPSLATSLVMILCCLWAGNMTDQSIYPTVYSNIKSKKIHTPVNVVTHENQKHSSQIAKQNIKYHNPQIKSIQEIQTTSLQNVQVDEQLAPVTFNEESVSSTQVGFTSVVTYPIDNGISPTVNDKSLPKTPTRWESNNHTQLHYEVYTTPSILNGINTSTPALGLSSTPTSSQETPHTEADKNTSKIYKSWEIEAGGAVLYDVNQHIRLKAGMQLNYSNYIFQSGKDASNSLITNSIEQPISTNGPQVNNPVYQISLPVGTELKLVGNGLLDWFAGASVQPTLLLSEPGIAQHYVDASNEQQSTSMFRKWNLHSTLETFVSVKLNKKSALKIGPQIRYQFMPSLMPTYSISERLYSIGLKLGITGGF